VSSVAILQGGAARWNVRRLLWRHPQWWSLVLCAAGWGAMLRPHAHHARPLVNWLFMTLAMMLPMVAASIATTAERSLWSRRHRAIAGFLAGFVFCWMLAGVAALFVPPSRGAAAVGFAVAGAWQLTRWKRIASAGCHRAMPLAPRGWRADRDCIRYGAVVGIWCIASCGAGMLACALTHHNLAAMLFLTCVGAIERYAFRPYPRALGAALFAASLISWLA
jgi:hypothetical protein